VAANLSKNLQANLQALLARNPGLAERICLPVSNDHVRSEADGSVSYQHHKDWLPLTLSEEQLNAAVDGSDPDVDVMIFGLGTGDILDRVLKHCKKAAVAAWEHDPWLLRQVLERRDYSKQIRQGRLIFSLGIDLLDFVAALKIGGQLVTHPLLSQVYRNELRLLRQGRGEKAALICAGGLLVEDVSEALREEGYSTATWDINQLSPEELQHTADRLQPSLVAAINYSHGLAEACEDANLPLLIWEIDPSTDKLSPTKAASTAHVFTYRSKQQQEYRNAGFPHVEYLPLAANTERRKPIQLEGGDAERYCNAISFVGNSMVDQGRRFRSRFVDRYCSFRGGDQEAAADEAEAAISTVLSAQSDEWCNYRIPELVQEHLSGFAQAMAAGDPVDHPIVLLSEMAAADKRLTFLANLGQVEIAVWGDEGWNDITEYGCRYMGPAGHRDELNRIYSGSTINLDIGRIYQSDIVTMRVFDSLACGGFVLTEHCEALDDLFEIGSEIESYRSFTEMLEKVEHYMEHPDEARAIAERGRARVQRDHTIAARMRYMLSSAGLRDAANH
jgi:spore maturation protein CgeB